VSEIQKEQNPYEFFKDYGDYFVVLKNYSSSSVRVEDLYQIFKARLIAELAVEAPDLRTLGIIVEKPQ